MKIINLRGTSGSGKTTLARAIMALYAPGGTVERYRAGRKRPIWTIHKNLHHPLSLHRPLSRDLIVLGHYQAACGGCDTITELDDVFNLTREAAELGCDVLLEGLILSGEIARTLALGQWLHAKGFFMDVIALNTPVDSCVANVNKRREARGQMEPVRPKNTVAKARCVELTMPRLTGQPGLRTAWATYDEALELSKDILDVR